MKQFVGGSGIHQGPTATANPACQLHKI